MKTVENSIAKINELGYLIQTVWQGFGGWYVCFRSPYAWWQRQAEGSTLAEALSKCCSEAEKLGPAINQVFSENWKPISNYEGWYEVSNRGNVRRIRAGKATRVGKILVPKKNKQGYRIIGLHKNGKKKSKRINILVCTAFNGPKPSPFHEVNHEDGNKGNDYASNLKWVTKKQNLDHAVKRGLIPSGSNDKRSKEYLITSPNGEKFVIKGIKEFCREHSLNSSSMISVAKGRRKSYKGWKCEAADRAATMAAKLGPALDPRNRQAMRPAPRQAAKRRRKRVRLKPKRIRL